jgi:uncharacterized protein YuzE
MMKVNYDKNADAIYIKISSQKPDGVIELKEGVNLDVSKDDRIVGIEILEASRKLSLKSFTSYQVSGELLRIAE